MQARVRNNRLLASLAGNDRGGAEEAKKKRDKELTDSDRKERPDVITKTNNSSALLKDFGSFFRNALLR